MRDGTVLRADAWTPAVGGPWPVLLQRLPYGRAVASAPVLPHPEQLARRGYAVIVQDVRGRGESGGIFRPFADDAFDGADTIEWAARLPFCDGQVATYGFSYQGVNQLAAAAQRPPSLRAIAPMMCAPDPYESWTYEGGCLRLPFVAGWSAQLAGQEPGAAPPPVDLGALPVRAALGLDPPDWFEEWTDHPSRDDYWAALAADLTAIEVPVFTVLGYFDEFGPGTQEIFARLGAEGVCGPWAHMPWGTRLGDVELGPDASPTVAHEALLRFFDGVLKGEPALRSRVTYYDNLDGWRTAEAWPPPTVVQRWWAGSDGRANSRHGDGRLTRVESHRGLRDVVVGEPLVPYPGTLDPLTDESAAEDRRDVLCYTSDPFEVPLSLAGRVLVRGSADADAGTHDVVVSLVEVDAAGVPRRLATGASRLVAATGDEHRFDLALAPVAWTIGAGHRLRLDVSLARFPAFDRNPHVTAVPVAAAGRGDCTVATVHLGGLVLELPVAGP